jgi:hypothetical protein
MKIDSFRVKVATLRDTRSSEISEMFVSLALGLFLIDLKVRWFLTNPKMIDLNDPSLQIKLKLH